MSLVGSLTQSDTAKLYWFGIICRNVMLVLWENYHRKTTEGDINSTPIPKVQFKGIELHLSMLHTLPKLSSFVIFITNIFLTTQTLPNVSNFIQFFQSRTFISAPFQYLCSSHSCSSCSNVLDVLNVFCTSCSSHSLTVPLFFTAYQFFSPLLQLFFLPCLFVILLAVILTILFDGPVVLIDTQILQFIV